MDTFESKTILISVMNSGTEWIPTPKVQRKNLILKFSVIVRGIFIALGVVNYQHNKRSCEYKYENIWPIVIYRPNK